MRGRTHRSTFPRKRPFALDSNGNCRIQLVESGHAADSHRRPVRLPIAPATRSPRGGDRRAGFAAHGRVSTAHPLDRRVRRRRGVGRVGMRSTAHWLSTPESDAFLASMARHSTGAQIEQLAPAGRRARTGEQRREQCAAAYLKFTVADDGTVTGSFRLPPAEGAELVQALEAGAGRLPDYDSDNPEATPRKGRKQASPRGYAWVLTAMTQQFLDALIGQATPSQGERFQLVIHSTAEQLARPDAQDLPDSDTGAELSSGARVHSSTLRRLTCDCPTSSIVEDGDGTSLHVGR